MDLLMATVTERAGRRRKRKVLLPADPMKRPEENVRRKKTVVPMEVVLKDPVRNRVAALPLSGVLRRSPSVESVAEARTFEACVRKVERLGLDPAEDVAFMWIPKPGVTYVYREGS